MTNPESRPEYQAAIIQLKADGLSPERLQARETYRQRIMSFISRTACMTEKPVEGETISKGE